MNESIYATLIEKLFARKKRLYTGASRELYMAASQLLGSPEKKFPSIIITGTNGKGSVSWKVAHALELAGYCTGLYTSPHVTDVRERIRINGELIPREEMMTCLSPLLIQFPFFSFFEILTFMMFNYFAHKHVDVAVLEVGIGGREDPTNLSIPIATAITSLSLDHTALLGGTLEEIAFHKVGIARPGVPMIVSETAYHPVVIETCQNIGAPLIQVPLGIDDFEQTNRATAREVLRAISGRFPISELHIEAGLLATPPGRYEKRGRMILDVAHNPGGIQALLTRMKKEFSHLDLFEPIVGISEEKDRVEMFRLIAQEFQVVHLPYFTHDKMVDPKALALDAKAAGITNPIVYPDIATALKSIDASKKVVVMGSCYSLSDVYAI